MLCFADDDPTVFSILDIVDWLGGADRWNLCNAQVAFPVDLEIVFRVSVVGIRHITAAIVGR